MKMIIFFILTFAACAGGGYLLYLCKESRNYDTGCSPMKIETAEFCVADYLDRIENAAIQLWEEQEPLDTKITLWWGLDGLKKSENGKLEWVKQTRKKSINSGTLSNRSAVELPTYLQNGCIDLIWDHEIIGNTYIVSKRPTIICSPSSGMCNVDRNIAGLFNKTELQISALQSAQIQMNQNIINQLHDDSIIKTDIFGDTIQSIEKTWSGVGSNSNRI